MEGIPNLDEISRADLILSANRALQCEVRPNMRHISVEYYRDQKKIIMYFFYDTLPTQEDVDYDVEGTITAEMSADFPSEVEWEEQSFLGMVQSRVTAWGNRCRRLRQCDLPRGNTLALLPRGKTH